MIFSKANFGNVSVSLIIQGCGAVTGVLAARLLGPGARGELATVILWPTIFANLGLMGCNWVLAREVATDPRREPEWAAAALAVAVGAATLYFAIGYFLLDWLIPRDRVYLLPLARLCLWLIPLDILNQMLLSVEHGRMRWRRYNALRVSFFLSYLVLVLLIGSAHRATVRWFVVAFLGAELLALAMRVAVQKGMFASYVVHASQCRHLLRTGVPYWGATMTNLVAAQLDTILVVSFLTAQSAGLYAVASAFSNAPASFGDALGITAFAQVSNESNWGKRQQMITATFRQSALLSAGIGLALASIIPWLMKPVFGAQFGGATSPAVILAIAASLLIATSALNQGLRGAGRPHPGLVSQLLGTGTMAASGALLLRGFGLMGMAWAVLFGAFVQMVALVIAAARWLKVSPLCFWPFAARDLRIFFQELAAFRFRYSKSAA